MDELTRGMIELRHVPGGTRGAYNAIYGGVELGHGERFWSWLLDHLDLQPGLRLLDVACGEAQLPRLVAPLGVAGYGVDLSEVALAKGLGGGINRGLAVADGERLPFADGSFERVTSIGSLEHYADPVRGAAELARVLAGDGLAAVLVPNTFGLRWNVLYAWRHGDPHDDGQPLQRYGSPGQWRRLLERAGLTVTGTLGYESLELLPAGPAGWWSLIRHPSRALIPLASVLPVNMASMLVFLCRKA